ncbi:MAG: hypothetical protein ACRDSL_15745 [Pseudonocardiaceae bacterium]
MNTDPLPQVYASPRRSATASFPEQREHLVTLLHLIDTAAALAPGGEQRYPDDPLRAVAYAAAWEPVDAGYRRLLDHVST